MYEKFKTCIKILSTYRKKSEYDIHNWIIYMKWTVKELYDYYDKPTD